MKRIKLLNMEKRIILQIFCITLQRHCYDIKVQTVRFPKCHPSSIVRELSFFTFGGGGVVKREEILQKLCDPPSQL